MICQERGEVLYHGFQTIRNRTDESTRSAYGLVLSSVIRNYGVTRFLWYNLFFLIYKNVVFSGQAEYSYFSADFSLKIFLYYSWIIKNLSYPFSGLFIFFSCILQICISCTVHRTVISTQNNHPFRNPSLGFILKYS